MRGLALLLFARKGREEGEGQSVERYIWVVVVVVAMWCLNNERMPQDCTAIAQKNRTKIGLDCSWLRTRRWRGSARALVLAWNGSRLAQSCQRMTPSAYTSSGAPPTSLSLSSPDDS